MMNEWIISSSILIAAVLLGRRLLRGRISLRLQYALWGVVLLRLLLPVQLFTSDFGAGAVARDVDISAPVRQVYVSAYEDRYEREYDAAYRQVAAQYEAADRHVDPVVIEKTAQEQAETTMELDLSRSLYHLWFAGMAVMTAIIAGCNAHLALQLKRRRWAMEVPESLLSVYVTEAVPTPCVFGLFRPAIYLTPEAAGEEQVRRHVLEHELTHYRHCDHIWSVLRSVCLVLHWYNPLVWVAAKVSRADAELACDEGALARLGESQRGDYGRTLIGLTCSAPISELLLTATTMTGSAGSIRERIKLLMARPRNTVLTVTAAILMVTLIVGCTFSGAPETAAPTETTPPETTSPSEPTGHAPDNDMAYTDEDLPIPDDITAIDPAEEIRDLFSADGNPHYRSALTELYAGPDSFDAASFFAAGQSAVTLSEEEKALVTEVYGKEALEHTVFRMTWHLMDRTLQQYIGTDTSYLDMSEFLFCPETEAYLLVREDVPKLRIPEILSLELPEENQAHMIYRFYGEEQTYCAILFKGETWKVYSNQLLIAVPQDARELNEKEIDNVRTGFAPSIHNAATGANDGNPLACFTHSMYADVSEMTKFDFLCYFPASGEGTKEELAMLIEKYPDYFDPWTTETMPLPVHRYDADALDDVMMEFAGIPFRDLPDGRWVHYLEETDSYYNYTSDFGLLGFPCTGGWYYDGGAILYTDLQPSSVLILTEQDGYYHIQAHLPAIVVQPSAAAEVTALYMDHYAPSMQEALEMYADRNPRELTDAELDQIHEAFKATIYDEKREITITNPVTAFFTSYYDDVRKLDLREFLRYFPTSGSAKETEFQQLKNKYGEEFDFADCETLAQMPVPVHCYRVSYIDEILRKYANLPFQELLYKDAEYHLESTDCYYNFTSDFGPGTFPCTEGFVYDGGAILYTDYAALYLEEVAGNYIITAHLPSRNLDPRKEAIAETLGAFFPIYEENINLNRDHSYDHLTVLAADPERTVRYQGKTVPLSDFHGNIEYLHGKEAYWRHVRQDSGILPDTFQVTSRIEDIAYDGDTAFVVAHDHVSFYYEGLGAPSGMGADFEILMVRVDDQWLIADIFERNDWFDADYKDDPNFDPEALIAAHIP